jgi:hypothetical protein
MSGSIVALRRRCGAEVAVLTLLATLSLALPAIATACIEDGGGEDRGPLIGAAQITPSSFSYEGGTAVVSGEVEDDCGIQQVRAEVSSTEGLYWAFQLLPYEFINSNTTLYRGEFQVPPNYQEWPVGYLAVIEAEDTNGSREQAYAGEAEVAPPPPFDEAPYVSGASLSPRVLGSAGGQVTIGVDAGDNRGLGNVFAIVTLPDETQKEVPLEGVSSSHFEGSFDAPANLGETPQEYTVVAYAEDDIGQTSSESAGSFIVSPPAGQLTVRPTKRFFGPVAIGDTATRLVVVRNGGGPKTLPVEASITTSGAPFSLQGAVGGKIDFLLGPGKTRAFAIDFAPVSPGYKVGSAIVSRADGAQPDISVTLTGQGVKSPAS